MRIYLASRFSNQEKMRAKRILLEKIDHKVTSRWIDINPEWDSEENRPKFAQKAACNDLKDISNSELVIFDLEEGAGRNGGVHVELGFAIANSKSCWVIGMKPTIFHWHPYVTYFDNWDGVLSLLKHCRKESEK